MIRQGLVRLSSKLVCCLMSCANQIIDARILFFHNAYLVISRAASLASATVDSIWHPCSSAQLCREQNILEV